MAQTGSLQVTKLPLVRLYHTRVVAASFVEAVEFASGLAVSSLQVHELVPVRLNSTGAQLVRRRKLTELSSMGLNHGSMMVVGCLQAAQLEPVQFHNARMV